MRKNILFLIFGITLGYYLNMPVHANSADSVQLPEEKEHTKWIWATRESDDPILQLKMINLNLGEINKTLRELNKNISKK